MKSALIIVGVVVALYVLPVPHSPIAYVLLLLLLGYDELKRVRKNLERSEPKGQAETHERGCEL